jgi:hypothetical protein
VSKECQNLRCNGDVNENCVMGGKVWNGISENYMSVRMIGLMRGV